MIDLVAADDASGFGVATALAIDGIPYTRVRDPRRCTGRVLVVACADADPAWSARARLVPTLVVGPAPALASALGVPCRPRPAAPVVVPLDAPVWPVGVRAISAALGVSALRLPAVTVAAGLSSGTVLATLDGSDIPAVVREGNRLWCAVDLGAALTALLDETEVPAPDRRTLGHGMPRAALAAYYRLPEPVRRVAQRRVYRALDARLAALGPRASTYPVDGTGWLLLALLRALLLDAAGTLVRLERWPAPWSAAATLTHDVEPSRYAYTEGLARLEARVARSGHAATYGLVATPATQHLDDAAWGRLARASVLCHGLEHRGETLAGSPAAIGDGLMAARQQLAARLGRPVGGFRSPRLDRGPTLLRALEEAGFAWDSSYPDVDRENVDHFGAGVRLTVPYRPPILDADGRLRPSHCLELPVSAPDCIQPRFAGDDLRAHRRAVRAKIDFVRATGGLYVGIVHAGVFGPRDADRREAHLAFVRRLLDAPDVWLASADDVARWWIAREHTAIAVGDRDVFVTYHGHAPVRGLVLVVETPSGARRHPLPPLPPGGAAAVPLDAPTRAPHADGAPR